MDRRTVLAIALSFVVIVVWQLLFTPSPPRPGAGAPEQAGQPEQQPGGGSGDRGEIASPRPESAEGPAFEVPGGAPGETIVVETGLFTATFASRGAGLVEYVLREYQDPAGAPLALVSHAAPEPTLGIDPDGPGAAPPIDLTSVDFQVSRRSANGLSIGQLVFTAAASNGARVERTFTFWPDRYVIDSSLRVAGLGTQAVTASQAWVSGLPVTEAYRSLDLGEFTTLVKVGAHVEQKGLGSFRGGKAHPIVEGNVRWAATRTKYFIAAMFLAEPGKSVGLFGDVAENRLGYTVESELGEGGGDVGCKLYIGPIVQKNLAELGDGIDTKVGIATMPLGQFFGWIAKGLYAALNAIHSVVPNYGVAILILALATKLIFYPLTRKSTASMKRMHDLKPEIDAVREKYKKDPQRMNQETFALYKKYGINPVAGCIPMLLQLPVFMALYGVLRSAIELRQAPFLLWVGDLAAPDTVADFGKLPLLPDQLHVLPLLMAGTTVLMSVRTMTDPRQRAMMYVFPVMMLFFFYNLPSGLTLYWTAQNLLAWVEQIISRGGVPAAAATKAA
jgi:YidC/Oxa1 family membrane protein insertase